MKILHVTNHFYPCTGGIESYVLDLCKELIKRGHKSDVACLNTCAYSKEKLPSKEIIDGINVCRMPYLNLKYYKIAPSIINFVKEYDVVHIHGIGFFSDFLSITKWLHKKPLILSTHGGIFHTKKIILAKQLYFNTITRLALKGIKKIIATGNVDYGRFSGISKNTVMIEPGIDYKKFSGIKRNTKKNTFLFVGRISKNKRIDNLIQAVGELKKIVPDIIFYVVGEDWDNSLESLQPLLKKFGVEKNAVFTGKVPDSELKEYYAKSQFFISASEYEGFGISVAEAMAAGCIPILNNIAAFRALVDDGENGFVVDFGNAGGSASAIYKAIKRNDLSKIAKNARAAAKKYDWAKIAGKLQDIYLEAISM